MRVNDYPYRHSSSTHDEKTSHKGCGNKHPSKCCDESTDKHVENCVEQVLAKILYAQRKVKQDHDCRTSCHDSIHELLGKNKKKATKNTVPIILYCGCEPFKGTGVLTYTCHSHKKKKLKCIESFIFKVKDLNDGCAVLELLAFKCDLKYSSGSCKWDHVCCQIDENSICDLRRTGICITVDLSCFCSVTCLPAVYL